MIAGFQVTSIFQKSLTKQSFTYKPFEKKVNKGLKKSNRKDSIINKKEPEISNIYFQILKEFIKPLKIIMSSVQKNYGKHLLAY